MVDDVCSGHSWPLWVEAGVSGAEERAFALPTGTVTFLLSDVEGSTQRWEASPQAMAVAIPRHYELLDAAIVGHGGVRPIEQGEGDSVVGAFSRASDAVAAAVAAQQALAAEPWPAGAALRVRVAVHTGEAQIRDHGYYLGPTLNRCARIRATGHGGQVLVSAATAALVTDRLPAQAALVDLGLHRLKDLGRPEHLWQLVHPDLPSSFPALRSLDLFHHNLPIQLTPLIGRGSEIVDVRRLLDGERLVTLTGSAGVGKSRLALAVAAEALDAQPGGVWWVELAPLADPSAVGRAALAALGARETPGAPAVQQLAVELGDQPSLLVLDNCEHLVAGCAELVAGLLAANPSASVLTTSREPLGVPGEITWRVPSMRCPKLEARLDIPTLSQYDAVVLFVERARRARPSFAVNEANAPAIAQICHRLDGIPLAIELAAARCRQMSVERVAVELDDRIRLLTGGARTVMARQQTLAASVDWSHDRLDDTEQVAFRRLSVFVGPFPLEAAEAVVASPGDLDPAEVFDLVNRLVDKSLVAVEDARGGEPHYRLLETLRAYALDRARTGGELTILRDAHARWWADWLEPRGAMPTDDILDDIEQYHANLKTALDWSTDQPALGLRLLAGMARAWEDLGRARDAMAAADRLLTDDNAQQYGADWLEAANRTSGLYFLARGPHEQSVLLDRIEAIAVERGDDYHVAMAQWPRESGDHTSFLRSAPQRFAAVRDLARERGDRFTEAWSVISVASRQAEDEPAAAHPLIAEAQTVARTSGMQSLRDAARLAEAELANSVGDLARGIELTRELVESRFSALWTGAMRVLSFAALLARDGEALRVAAHAGDRVQHNAPGPALWIYNARHRLGMLEGQPSLVDDRLRVHDPTTPPSNGTLWLVCREAIDADAAEVAGDNARAKARLAPHCQAVLAAVEAAATGNEDRWHDALAIALEQGLRLIAVDALEGLAVAAAGVEGWAECLRLLTAAERLRDETGYRWRFGFEQQAVDTARTAAMNALGDDADMATTEGRILDWQDAAAYARRARGERKRPQHGWTGLTPTEQQVVALVAQGLTNPEIAERLLMGRATVKTHLAHIFAKLGVRTRAELAGEAARRPPR
jgi:predicted ATPase/class 3 adenylate cyclase/DNA-binding CsgD family transcriptional regulator